MTDDFRTWLTAAAKGFQNPDRPLSAQKERGQKSEGPFAAETMPVRDLDPRFSIQTKAGQGRQITVEAASERILRVRNRLAAAARGFQNSAKPLAPETEEVSNSERPFAAETMTGRILD